MTKSYVGLDKKNTDLEVMNAFHVAPNTLAVSIELSNKTGEKGRSFLLLVRFDGLQIVLETKFEVPNRMLSHISVSPDDHWFLEVGGVVNIITAAGVTATRLPDPFFHRLFRVSSGEVFGFGEDGAICQLVGIDWRPFPATVRSFLRSMHGLSLDSLLVVGDHGTVLQNKGDRWQRLDLNLGHAIEVVCVSADGTVSFGCDDGLCYQKVESELFELQAPESDFMAICDFKGRRYWGENDFGLFVQKGNRLEEFRGLEFVYAMEASKDLLVVVGWHEVFTFDGEEWRGIEFGYDGNLFAKVIDMRKRYVG